MPCVLVWLLGTHITVAQPRTLGQAVSVPEGALCLSHDAVVEHTRTWLGHDNVDEQITVVIELGERERAHAGFVLLHGETVISRRVFAELPQSCVDRRAALSLALAMALDASVLERIGAGSGQSVESADSATEDHQADPIGAASDVSGTVPVSRTEVQSVYVDVSIDGGIRVGALPARAGVGRLEIAIRHARGWQILVAGQATTRATSNLGRGKARSQLATGSAAACLQSVWSVETRACLGFSLGRLISQGSGYDQPQNTELWWAAGEAELSARWPQDARVSMRFGLRGHLKIIRPVLEVRSEDGSRIAQDRLSIAGMTGFFGIVATLR